MCSPSSTRSCCKSAPELQSGNVQAAKELQLVLFMGLLIAAVLVLLVLLMIGARQRQDASLREARQQTMDILRTVKDGLFLLDRDLVIGTTFSSALETLFQRRDIAGLSFESLLKNIVSEKTLDTALKFVTVSVAGADQREAGQVDQSAR